MKITTITATVSLLTLLPLSSAVVSLTPGDINGLDTTTTVFSNADITLTPYQGATQATFNGNATRLGIDDFGTNVNAFNDSDTDPNNGNEERLEFDFAPTAGLVTISWDFSRANGPGADDGVFISGFLSDPMASLTGGTGSSFVSYSAGVLEIDVTDFTQPDTVLTLASPAASAGQTLSLIVTDTTQAGAQLAITGISYENAIPEPSSFALLSLGGLALLRRRR